MSALKVVAVSVASLLLLPVLVLGAIAGSFDTSGSVNVPVDASALQRQVLEHPAIRLTANARRDVVSGVVDPRVLQVLLALAQSHELGPVGPFVTGHSYYVKGTTRVSNHVGGRAVDILGVDGSPVSPSNDAARAVIAEALALPSPIAPNEVGGPWILRLAGRGSFTDGDHQDHIHIGFEETR